MARAKRKPNDETLIVVGSKPFCMIHPTAVPTLTAVLQKVVSNTGQDNSAMADLAGISTDE